MTPVSVVVASFFIGLALSMFLFINPVLAVIFTVIGAGVAILLEAGRRQRARRRTAPGEVKFTERDRETLHPSDGGATRRSRSREEAGGVPREPGSQHGTEGGAGQQTPTPG